jgi:TMEM175 potassium channel family protein
MGKNRLEAFSDGVLAIVITIMVLELKVPHGDSWDALSQLVPTFFSYVLSFVYVGIYWNNHHHMFHTVTRVNGSILWANLALLFWLSLIPFVTGWMGENHFGARPVAAYGFVLMMAAIAYYVLTRTIIRHHGEQSLLRAAVGKDLKGKVSVVLYLVAIGLSFVNHWLGLAVYAVVAIMWLLPDRRIEHVVSAE